MQVCRALLSSLIINSHSDLTNTSTIHSFLLSNKSIYHEQFNHCRRTGNESPLLMSSLSLWRLCWWSSDSAPVHSKTQKGCSLQRGKGGGGLGQEWPSWLPSPWLWVVFTISPLKLRCKQLPAHLLLLQLDTATNVLASAELALGSQHLPCDGCHWCRNRAGQWPPLDPKIWCVCGGECIEEIKVEKNRRLRTGGMN